MNHRTYVVIPAATVESVKFDEVLETSEETLRWNLADPPTHTFVKFVGDTPDFLEGLTSYNHDEIRTLLASSEWSEPDPE